VISAQGSESGGYCGDVSTMTLVPQVVDAVSPTPVVASGGIFDGRGIAAALMLDAVGVNLAPGSLRRRKHRRRRNGNRRSSTPTC
jgi:enoyl-[acyl-carrier protein] reductase II